MKSIKNFEDKKLTSQSSNTVKGGERTPTQNNDLVIIRGDKVKYKTGVWDGHIGRDGW